MEHINYLTIHASATFPSMDIDIEWIRDIHLGKGWNDVGYHYFIKRDGTVEKGREDNIQGAHTYRHNNNNLGICMAGGLKEGTKEPEDNFTPIQYMALTRLLAQLLREHPDAKIMGHNGFYGHETRGCPCFDWESYKTWFRKASTAPYRPADWHTQNWKEGVPLNWLMPSNWYQAVHKE